MIETYTPDFTQKATHEFAWTESGRNLFAMFEKKINYARGCQSLYLSIRHEARPSITLNYIQPKKSPATIVMENYGKLPLQKIADIAGIPLTSVWQIARMLGFKCDRTLNYKDVINLETGVFYDSIKDAANCYGVHTSTLAKRLRGEYPNNTSFRLA